LLKVGVTWETIERATGIDPQRFEEMQQEFVRFARRIPAALSHRILQNNRTRECMMTTRSLARTGGLFFEEFTIGDSVESVGRTITEADIVNFAALSGDWNLIHSDAEYSKAQMFGQRVAHGLLVLSIASGLAVRLGFMEETVMAFRGLEWRFTKPIFIGDTVRLRVTVEEKKEMRRLGGGLVTFAMEVVNQNNEVVQRGTWEILCKGKG
jgi:acyl dehydratase